MGKGGFFGELEPISRNRWRIRKNYKSGMRVDGIIFADEHLIDDIRADQAPEQVANVACLPGIQMASLAMPDIHWGYGFCIGGVCATDPDQGGVISPGGVGYDINCGVRLVRSNLRWDEVSPRLEALVNELFDKIPAGVGRGGKVRFDARGLIRLMGEGPRALIKRDLATEGDIEFTEANGYLTGADPDRVSRRALARGEEQCGTLGSGNHFLEIQRVEKVFDEKAANAFGLSEGMVCVMIHSGSRGLGYQVCEDALMSLRRAPEKYGIQLPDKQLVCAPIDSDEGKRYLATMCSAANYAWCNRQILMMLAREAFAKVLDTSWEKLQMGLVYDVAHNIAKLEEHAVDGETKKLWVHRKGATRAFPAGHPEVPSRYQEVGQPVIIPGDMGRASWVMAGAPGSMEMSFGSACHGAGRRLSRTAAASLAHGKQVQAKLSAEGIIARGHSTKGLAEEQPDAYKDVDRVVEVVHQAGLATKVARLKPVGVVKG